MDHPNSEQNIAAMAMGTWKKNSPGFRKSNPSRASGKSKGINPSTLQRSYCKRNRSWKWPNYDQIMQSLGSRKKK